MVFAPDFLWPVVRSSGRVARVSQGAHRIVAFLLWTTLQELATAIEADGLTQEWNEDLLLNLLPAVQGAVGALRGPLTAERALQAAILLSDAYYASIRPS